MSNQRILMATAENDALPGAKVGGVGDVLRDLPPALVKQGLTVGVIIPAYGFLARLPNLETCGVFPVNFSGRTETVTLFKLELNEKQTTTQYILHHKNFSPKGETVYCNDNNNRPFATDATKFSFFSMAILEAIKQQLIPTPDILHCHDWHTAFLLILLKFSTDYTNLQNIKTIFTIHNLAMQGIRPFAGDDSSFEAWYPTLKYDPADICDINNPHCINPMRAAINLANKVHTVSPTYAREILHTSNQAAGIYGGESLEFDLQKRNENQDLIGIINGCEYPRRARYAPPAKKSLLELATNNVVTWASKQTQLASAHFVADKRLKLWGSKKHRGFTLTSIGRITEQKARLLQTKLTSGKTALEGMLDLLGDKNQFIMLGSGDTSYEDFLVSVSGKHENFIFLNGYANDLPDQLYRYGDLFLMPSSFEPCGISQMLAMRAAQPCLVNRVGGLKDTVFHNGNGFCFEGKNITEQAENMLVILNYAMDKFTNKPEAWKNICRKASASRYTWDESAKQYVSQLFT